MSPFWIQTSVFVAIAGLSHAQSSAVLGRADAEFAAALLRGGYPDLAEQLCGLLETQGDLPPEEAAGVKALHLDLRLDLALREADLYQRKELLTRILEAKEDLVRQYAGRKVAEETSASLPDVYQKLGETISRAIQAEKDPGLIQQLQKEGGDVFEAAEAKLEARIAELKGLLADATTPNPKLEEALVTASYNLPRTRYFHSLLYGASDTLTRDVHLDAAIAGFMDFNLDYADTIFGIEALVYEGLCYKEKGEWEDALTAFDDVIYLRDNYEQDARGVYPLDPILADLISWAVLQKVTLLLERNLTAEALEEGKVFLETTPDVDQTRHGLAVRAQMARAHLKAGDIRAAGAQADAIVAADPRGPWGAEGRAIQGQLLQSGGSIDPSNVLQIAQTLYQQGEVEQSLRIARQAISAANKDSKAAGAGVDAWLFVGSVYLAREWEHEAAAAFDAAIEQFGSHERVPEAVYQSMRVYSRLQKAEKKKYYQQRAEERQKQLATKFAAHPRAWEAQLFEADQLVAEGQHVAAAELYGRVQPSAPSYLLAQYKAGESYFLHALELFKTEATQAEGRTFAGQAEALMKKALAEADKSADETLDPEKKPRLESVGLQARASLAQLYLRPEYAKYAEVIPLLAGADERYASNADAIAGFWRFRIEALRAQGQYEEAIGLLEALIKRDPESRSIGIAAGNLARELDQRSDQLLAENKAREAEEMRKKAANFYAISGRALLKAEPLNVPLVEQTANRLFALGLIANQVPDTRQTFVGWEASKNRETASWTLAAELLEKALAAQPGYRMEVTLGRTLGFLGEFQRAADVLGALFDREVVYDAEKNRLNTRALNSKPELLYAYFEYGVAEHLVGAPAHDTDRLRRAQTILSTMGRTLDANGQNWWYAKYYEIRNFAAGGNYTDACFALNDLDRTTSGFGKEYGLDDDFAQLKSEIQSRCK